MKSVLMLICGIILIIIGIFGIFSSMAMSFPFAIEVNSTFRYLVSGLFILGILLAAGWFIGKLINRW